MLGVSRQTIAKRLRADDMSLQSFIELAQALNVDPGALIAESIHQSEELASKEGEPK